MNVLIIALAQVYFLNLYQPRDLRILGYFLERMPAYIFLKREFGEHQGLSK